MSNLKLLWNNPLDLDTWYVVFLTALPTKCQPHSLLPILTLTRHYSLTVGLNFDLKEKKEKEMYG